MFRTLIIENNKETQTILPCQNISSKNLKGARRRQILE